YLVGAADGNPLRRRRGGGHRLDQFGGEPRRLREPFRGRSDTRQDAQHGPGRRRAGLRIRDVAGDAEEAARERPSSVNRPLTLQRYFSGGLTVTPAVLVVLL